jgi:hypothetical protein
MSPLTLKGFLTIAALAALLAFAGIVIAFASQGWLLAGVVLGAVAGHVIGLLVAGVFYLVAVTRNIARLRVPPKELGPGEVVVLEMAGTLVHFRSGRPVRSWEGVGGKVVLTSRRLVFLAHRGQPWHYRVELPLGEIAAAEAVPVLNGLPGGLRVVTTAGKRERFMFGVHRDLDAEQWAAAILLARYRAYPEWGADESA